MQDSLKERLGLLKRYGEGRFIKVEGLMLKKFWKEYGWNYNKCAYKINVIHN
jgi:hypothetical protein